MKRRTGRELDRDLWEERKAREAELDRQDQVLRDKLERQGESVCQGNLPTVKIGLMTGTVKPVSDLKNRNFFPSRQARNASAMLALVEFWCATVPQSQLRMFVVDVGWVKLSDYREAHKGLRRWISKFFAKRWVKDAGLELCFSNIESTHHRDNDGDACRHLHSHMIVRSRRRLGREGWTDLIARIRRNTPKGYFHDSPLRKPAECVKYCFKPSELENDLTGPELVALWRQVEGLKFYQPAGDMRELSWNLKQANQKLVRDGEDWLRLQRKTRPPADEEPPHLRDVILTTEDPDSPGEDPEPTEPLENYVVGYTAPSADATPYFEPYAIVRNATGDFTDVFHQERFQEMQEKAAYWWDRNRAGEAGPSMQHTTTTTVPERNADVDVRPPP